MEKKKKDFFDLLTICWNEIQILPYVVSYWKKCCNHVYVYDMGSTDGSIEYMKQYDFITVIKLDTNDFDDTRNLKIKNEYWKNINCEYICICDLDEVPYFTCDIHNISKFACIRPKWYDLCSKEFPILKDNELLHQECTLYETENNNQKLIIFNTNKVKDINYDYGCHNCNPTLYDKNDLTINYNDSIYMFHITNIGFDYKIKRKNILKERLSRRNIYKHLGIHYFMSDKQLLDIMNYKLQNSNKLDI